MRKFTSIMAVLLVAATSVAQNLNFTFTRGNQTATVTTTGIDGVTATITATAPQADATTNDGLWNTGQTMATATDILCTMTNTKNATEAAPIIYTLSISGLEAGATFAQAEYISKAVNAGGIYQTVSETRHCNFSLTANNENAGSINNLSIMVNSNSGATVSAIFESDKLVADADGNLVLTLKIWVGTTNGGCFYGLQSITLASNLQQAELEALIEEYEAMSFTSGTEIGLYNATTVNAFNEAIAAAKEITDATQEDIDNLTAAYNAIEFNAPETGKYYRLKNYVSNNYMSANADGSVKVITDGSEAASTIFFLAEGNKLLSYTEGRFLDCNGKNLATIGTSHEGVFATASNGAAANVITYKNNGYWTYGAGADDANIDRGSITPNSTQTGYNWYIEEVTELPVTMSTAGYATLYLPVATTINADVEAYTVSNVGDTSATLSQVNGTIPANCGVILKAKNELSEAATFAFTIAEDVEAIENKLAGSAEAKTITPADNTTYYILAMADGEVGLYPDELDGGSFQNNANKAYLPVTSESAAAGYSFVFDWAGTTGIEGVAAESAQNGKIYDITGREVKAMTVPGLYIINGKKVVK